MVKSIGDYEKYITPPLNYLKTSDTKIFGKPIKNLRKILKAQFHRTIAQISGEGRLNNSLAFTNVEFKLSELKDKLNKIGFKEEADEELKIIDKEIQAASRIRNKLTEYGLPKDVETRFEKFKQNLDEITRLYNTKLKLGDNKKEVVLNVTESPRTSDLPGTSEKKTRMKIDDNTFKDPNSEVEKKE